MKKAHMPDSHGAHPNVTPLIDIVMCLIIFFMLIAKIGVNTGAKQSIKVPSSVQGIDLKIMGNSVVFNVEPGTAAFPRVSALLKQANGRDVEEHFGEANKLIASLVSLKGKGKDDFKVVVRAPEHMMFSELQKFLKACSDARVTNIAYNTRKVITTTSH